MANYLGAGAEALTTPMAAAACYIRHVQCEVNPQPRGWRFEPKGQRVIPRDTELVYALHGMYMYVHDMYMTIIPPSQEVSAEPIRECSFEIRRVLTSLLVSV